MGIEKLQTLNVNKRSTQLELFRRLERGKAFIHENVKNRLNLDETARQACLSKYYFIRLFKQLYGMSPYQYYIGLKIHTACDLLERGDKSITDISIYLGFSDVSSFSNTFKKIKGVSPSNYTKDTLLCA